MAFDEHPPPVYNDDLDDDDDDSDPLNGAVPEDDDDAVVGDSESSSETDDGDTNSVAIPTSVVPPPPSVTVALPDPKRHRIDEPLQVVPPEKKPIDDSRRLFQRLWTDEDEIGLLQGFLEYTTIRGTSGHHHDTTAFYDQIKSKLQLDFNKNQLVEKLRRLKKKYRTVLSRMNSGKEFVFKSPHDQSTFEISSKIWGNAPANHRGAVELDEDDQNPNPNPNSLVTTTPPPFNPATPSDATGPASKLSTRKRPRVVKLEDNNNNSNVGVGSAMQGLIEETVKNCLVPVFKELMNNAVNAGAMKGVGALTMNFSGVNNGEAMDDKWRKQQILELEVYSKRLELVQDQIKSTLEELNRPRVDME